MEATDSPQTLHDLFVVTAKRFNDKTAILYKDEQSIVTKVPYERLLLLSTSIASFIECHNIVSAVIGVFCKPSLALPAILIGILKIGKAFCALNPRKNVVTGFATAYVISETSSIINKNNFAEIVDQLETEVGKVYLLKINDEFLQPIKQGTASNDTLPLAYVVQTSGTTGSPKSIRVPHQCIVPNIVHLSSIFCVTLADVIPLLSPLTFDPSVVEIFVALTSGAALLVVPEAVRIVPKQLSKYLMDNGVTVMQATPSLIQRLGQNILREEILTKNSSLRILAMGGEVCPDVHTLRCWKAEGNRTLIYNLYGTTEVSCWASYYHVSESEWDSLLDGQVPLGKPLSETILQVRTSRGRVVHAKGKGQLFIGSHKRFCFLNNSDDEYTADDKNAEVIWRATGDWVHVRKEGIFFVGRKDNIVKYNGKRVNMDRLRAVISSLDFVHSSSLVFSDQVLFVFLVLKDSCLVSSDAHLTKDIIARLRLTGEHLPPVRAHRVLYLPLTSHGKVNIAKLLGCVGTKANCSRDFGVVLKDLWCSILGTSSVSSEDNFVQSGGNSVDAVQLSMEVEFALGKCFPSLVDQVLNSTFGSIVQLMCDGQPDRKKRLKLSVVEGNGSRQLLSSHFKSPSISQCYLAIFRSLNFYRCNCRRCSEETITYPVAANSFTVSIRWRFDLFKCIDSSPLLVSYRGGSTVVFVGSHDGTFAAIDHRDGSLFWTVRVKDRIESSPCLSTCGTLVLVGCYDYCLYCFCVATGQCRWVFQTGSEVKSSPICEGLIAYCGSHDGCLYALDVEDGSCIWSTRLGTGSVFSSPTSWKQPPRIYIASLDGAFAAVLPESGQILWKHSCGKAIFSSAVASTKGVCVGCVDGRLLFWDHDGICLWSYDSESPLFCSPSLGMTGNLLCGNHGGRVFCLDEDSGKMIWNSAQTDSVYSRQCLISLGDKTYVAAVAINGVVEMLDAEQGQKFFSFNLDGQVFSSPIFHYRSFIVGCRNNFLYCFDFLNSSDNCV